MPRKVCCFVVPSPLARAWLRHALNSLTLEPLIRRFSTASSSLRYHSLLGVLTSKSRFYDPHAFFIDEERMSMLSMLVLGASPLTAYPRPPVHDLCVCLRGRIRPPRPASHGVRAGSFKPHIDACFCVPPCEVVLSIRRFLSQTISTVRRQRPLLRRTRPSLVGRRKGIVM
jgi:hypothetical protein